MTTAVFPGSFDPPTYGHINIIERASRLFDAIDVVISINPDKHYLFSEEERLSMIRQLTEPYGNVSVHACSTLIVDYCKKVGAKVLIRGIRNVNDFSYEFDLSLINRSLNNKELARFGGDISGMVPPVVEQAMREKYRGRLRGGQPD